MNETTRHFSTLLRSNRLMLVRGLALIASVALLAVSATLIWAALSAAVGIVFLMILVIIGIVVFQAVPLAIQKLENRMLNFRRAEASANPISQLQNEVIRRAHRLQSFRQALATVGGQIETINELLTNCRHRDPSHVLERQQRALGRLQQFHSLNMARMIKAQEALDEFRATVERKASEWDIAYAIGEASDLLDPHSTESLLQDLLADTALRSVQQRFNKVFAELDMQMTSIDGPTQKLVSKQKIGGIDYLHLSHPTGNGGPT